MSDSVDKRAHRSRIIVIVLGVLAVVLIAAIPLAMRYSQQQEVRRAIVNYDLALADALRTLDPSLLDGHTTGREKGRVESYIASLWGRGVYVDGEMLDFRIESVQSADPTVTVVVRETWRYTERDRSTRKQIGDPIEEDDHLTVTLVRINGKLYVHLTEDVEAQAPEPGTTQGDAETATP